MREPKYVSEKISKKCKEVNSYRLNDSDGCEYIQ